VSELLLGPDWRHEPGRVHAPCLCPARLRARRLYARPSVPYPGFMPETQYIDLSTPERGQATLVIPGECQVDAEDPGCRPYVSIHSPAYLRVQAMAEDFALYIVIGAIALVALGYLAARWRRR
jgi:hypothetical protein